jgi:hypothetical protein
MREQYHEVIKEVRFETYFAHDWAMILLGLDPKKKADDQKFSRYVKARARQNVLKDPILKKHYWACPDRDKNRYIFTKDKELLAKQFANDRRQRMAGARTLVPLSMLCEEMGVDTYVDFPWWGDEIGFSLRVEQEKLNVEEQQRELAQERAKFERERTRFEQALVAA